MKNFEEFGFLDFTGSDIQGEGKTFYWKNSNTKFGNVELGAYSFGQTFKTTVLQELRAVSAVANGGRLVTPHLAKYLTDKDGNIIHTYAFENDRQVISKKVADDIVEMLAGGIKTGSTVNASVEGYSVAAKTGTSQKMDKKGAFGQDIYISSCVAFAPAEAPQIAMIVMVDEPSSGEIYGGVVAAPVIANVLKETLPYLEVPKTGVSEHENVSVTKYIDRNAADAKKAIEALGLKCRIEGTGETVLDQMPRSGTVLTTGGTVILYTEETETRPAVKVPDTHSKRAQEAIKMLYDRKLNIRITGAYSTSVTGRTPAVVMQDIDPGTEVPEGTVVTIELRYFDGIDG